MDSTRPATDSPEVLALVDQGLKLVPFVVRQARALIGSSTSEEDLVAFANMGAMLAARSFDPSRRVPFPRWASLKMRGAIIDGLRRAGEVPRRMRERLRELEALLAVEETFAEEDAHAPATSPEAADARLNDYLAAMATSLAGGILFSHDWKEMMRVEDERLSAQVELEAAELRVAVQEAIGALPEKERTIVEKHWSEGLTIEEAGASMGLSKSWSSRLHTRAIAQLTRALQRRGVSA